jgi:DNA-directed RNA polymerase subunit omega
MMDPLSLLPDSNQQRFDSRYRLVITASQRAKHLLQGARPVGAPKFLKETTIALEEVLRGQVEFLTDKEARQAIKDAKRSKESEMERMVAPDTGEDAREIKKELSVYVDDSAKPSEPEGEE